MRLSCRSLPAFLAILGLAALTAAAAPAEEKLIGLPSGTTVEKTDAGCWTFTLPDGCRVSVKGYARSRGTAAPGVCGTLGECAIHDKAGRLVALGGSGTLKSAPAPLEEAQGAAEPPEIVVEGAAVRLPAVIAFEPTRVFNRMALARLSPAGEDK